jgi:uncharacterized lipoprotein YddW (UPF0748 family)
MRKALQYILSLYCLMHLGQASLEGDEIPKYELRSVWVATAAGLDFPKTTDPSVQQTALRNIIRWSKELGLNAVVFQVVARGDAMYPSDRLPWAWRLTGGQLGTDPGWDPLAFAIEETHALGMEFHAWYNVFRYGDTGEADKRTGAEPPHVADAHPEWIQVVGTEIWLNPGIPDARAWSVGNVIEIVENYDIDAIHFDFIRYPSGGFSSDANTKLTYNPKNIALLSDWRRDNVSEFVRDVAAAIRNTKPWVKIGSTPVGHYKTSGGWAALYGYSDVFQDSRLWLQEGNNDYLAPQIYWAIGTATDAPRYEWLVNDWMSETYDRHVYIGVAAYKTNVYVEIPAEIDTARAHGAHGQVYFRYDFVSSGTPFGNRYNTPALVPVMEWRDEIFNPPVSPVNVRNEWIAENRLRIEWDSPDVPEEGDTLRRYAVYRINSPNPPVFPDDLEDGRNLIALSGMTYIEDALEPAAEPYHYFVTTLNRNFNESDPGNIVTVTATSVPGPPSIAHTFELRQNYPNPFNPSTIISFSIPEQSHVSLRVYDMLGREVGVLVDEVKTEGVHSVTFHADDLASGMYIYRLTAGDHNSVKRMVLVR